MGQGERKGNMVKKSAYIPDAGDIVWINFNPTKGHEQAGSRPAIVVSHRAYNVKSGLAMVCPITSQIKGYPFEVMIDVDKIKGVALVDQMRSVDREERKMSYICKSDKNIIIEIKQKLIAIIG